MDLVYIRSNKGKWDGFLDMGIQLQTSAIKPAMAFHHCLFVDCTVEHQLYDPTGQQSSINHLDISIREKKTFKKNSNICIVYSIIGTRKHHT